ncbi:MAG: ImmA/IrrE family metallo-endopeptidase [Verrucomicrobiota bacterium]
MNILDNHRAVQIENLANATLEAFDIKNPPVDVLDIARQEEIEAGALPRGSYSDEFSGRIEFHKEIGRFLLFHPEIQTADFPSRVRFSIAHELGHYYIPEHRQRLIEGKSHDSKAGFICDDNLEKEADHFASVFLLPTFALRAKLGARGFLTLQQVLDLASEWKTSATSAVLRYIKFATEPCAAIVSRGGKILYYVPSEEAGEMGFKYLGKREIPGGTPSMKAGVSAGSKKITEGSTSTNTWFSARRADATIWEEAFPLGYTNLVITLFAFENDPNGQMGFKRFSN